MTETGEILTAIVNLAAANRELWPYDQVGSEVTDNHLNNTNVSLQTSDHLWTTLHNYGFLRDVTPKSLQLEIMREWFNAVQVRALTTNTKPVPMTSNAVAAPECDTSLRQEGAALLQGKRVAVT